MEPLTIHESIGINEMDAYAVMWYGNHIKWFRRAASRFWGEVDILHVRYMQTVRWGGDCSVQGVAVDDSHHLLEMLVDGAVACEALVRKRNSGAPPPRTCRRLHGLVGNSTQPMRYTAPLESEEYTFAAWKDSLQTRQLREDAVLDLFEQARTRFLGGQSALKELADAKICIVVSQIDHLVYHASESTEVTTLDTLRCRVDLLHHVHRMIWQFRQELRSSKGSLCASMFCKLAVNREGVLAALPVQEHDVLRARRLPPRLSRGVVAALSENPAVVVKDKT